jgi:hypothetical protein
MSNKQLIVAMVILLSIATVLGFYTTADRRMVNEFVVRDIEISGHAYIVVDHRNGGTIGILHAEHCQCKPQKVERTSLY